jgi:hypothetical protein
MSTIAFLTVVSVACGGSPVDSGLNAESRQFQTAAQNLAGNVDHWRNHELTDTALNQSIQDYTAATQTVFALLNATDIPQGTSDLVNAIEKVGKDCGDLQFTTRVVISGGQILATDLPNLVAKCLAAAQSLSAALN